MNARRSTSALITALVLAAMSPVMGQWVIEDDVASSAGAMAVLRAADGSLYAAGRSVDGGIIKGTIRRSADEGLTWTTVDLFYSSTSPASTYRLGIYQGLAQDPAGRLYAVGLGYNDQGVNTWFTRRSTDGVHFSTVDAFQLVPASKKTNGAPAWGCAVGGDVSGAAVFATGVARDAQNNSFWIVRRTLDGGSTWTTVMSLPCPSMQVPSEAFRFAVLGTPAGVLVGASTAAGAASMIRRSTDLGATWTTVDTYQFTPGSASGLVEGLVADAAGTLYAQHFSSNHLVIRRSQNGGQTWSTINDATGLLGRALHIDASGTLWSSGSYSSASGGRWFVRKSIDGGATFTTDDDFQLQIGKNASALGLASSASGSILAAGYGYDASSNMHWIVRRREGAALPPIPLADRFELFRRGDPNGDGRVDIADPILLLDALYLGRRGPACPDAGDADDDGTLSVIDPIRLLQHLFLDAAPLPTPSGSCGIDQTPDDLPSCTISQC